MSQRGKNMTLRHPYILLLEGRANFQFSSSYWLDYMAPGWREREKGRKEIKMCVVSEANNEIP